MKKMFKIVDDVNRGYIDTLSINKNEQDICFLWNKLVDYANYWELFTPTCNGNPDFIALDNFIKGFACAKGWEINEEETKILIKNRSGNIIINMSKRQKPKEYFEAIKEINSTINAIFNY